MIKWEIPLMTKRTKIKAMLSGYVIQIYDNGVYVQCKGVECEYKYLSKIKVKLGQKIRMGQVLGCVYGEIVA